MSYELAAVIGARADVAAVARQISAVGVTLTGSLGLLPWTAEMFDALGDSDSSAEPAGFRDRGRLPPAELTQHVDLLDNGGSIDVWEVDVRSSAFDDATQRLTSSDS